MIPKPIRWFIISAGIILLVTGSLKLIASAGTAQILTMRDPVFYLSNRHVLLIVGALEIVIGWFCLARKQSGVQMAAIAGIAACFVVYRAGLMALGVKAACNCLGHITDGVGMDPNLVDNLLKSVIVYLLAGSLGGLLFLYKKMAVTGKSPQKPAGAA